MNNFNSERLFMSALAYGFAQVCFDEALDWARQRSTFGQTLSQRQIVRHKLMDMMLRIDAARSLVHDLAYRIEHRLGDPAQLVARIAMAKVLAGTDRWGAKLVDRMAEEHIAEHAAFWELLSGTRTEVVARICELAEELDAHMAAEERTFLSPEVVRRRARTA